MLLEILDFLWNPKDSLLRSIWFFLSLLFLVLIRKLSCSTLPFFILVLLFFGINMMVFLPFTVLIPWDNCPSSFANDCSQNFLFWPLTTYLYSWATPDMGWVSKLAYIICIFFLSMHSLVQYVACIWISSLRLDRPCPPLEVPQDAPLVVMQVRLGELCVGLYGICGRCSEYLLYCSHNLLSCWGVPQE